LTQSSDGNYLVPNLRFVAWEITRRCNLSCAHCRASSEDVDYQNELTTEECFRLIDSLLEAGKPILILTGGEPLYRDDIFEIGKYATGLGLRVVLGTNGTLITKELAGKLKGVPVSRVSISIDFPTPELQDGFRGMVGAFDAAVRGACEAREAGIEVQVNSTITRMNAEYMEDLLNLALELGAVAFHPFMLVPTGRGKALADVELPPGGYERILNWVYDKQLQLGDRISFKPTDAPHYMRITQQRRRDEPQPMTNQAMDYPNLDSVTRGCLAGTGFCFISHIGRVQGCGYLDVEAGDVRQESFKQIWYEAPLFEKLRNLSNLKGKCGLCEYRRPCGGCRARAYEVTGDYLAPEPYCIYQPKELRQSKSRVTP
jgi:heme b synthase